ncbi:UPF0481 protein At3g47200-like [Macadamia integrifolia]|uniref:UPF0481 protein At3g47200-like n=1 Tax=Macadamia integrifolia TaxID=60698 RepID=UPI001C4F5FB2|nr:UPF0481 protein At3g47200-like [Macadamia integrifolia]
MDEEEETHAHSIDINDSIRTKLAVRRSNPSLAVPISCIYRVHKRIRKMNEDAYTPDIVSIGPYHRGMENLQAMEDLKLQYLQTLLDRTRERTSLEEYVEALKKLEDEARGCYSEPIKLSSNEFIEMMLFDGFFIIELFRKNFNSQYFRIDDNDLIFYSKSRSAIVVRDLVLLENQIPMSILEKLFNLSMDPKHDSLPLIKMALYFFSGLIPQAMHKYPQNKDNIEVVAHNHLLDLLAYTLDSSLRVVKMPDLRTTVESLPCVTELLCSGVKFKKSPIYNGSLIDIKYNEGVIEIPQLCVHDFTESFFRNLMAYEQYRFGGTPYITSYATLMDYLINSVDDVAFLRDWNYCQSTG